MGFSCLNCGDQRNQIVNCLDCNELFCGNCDEQNTSNPFHERVFFSKTRPGKQLLPTEFIDHDGKIFVKSVRLVLRSTKCHKCQTLISLNTSSEINAVVTPKGLFIYLFYVKNVFNSFKIFSDRDVQPEWDSFLLWYLLGWQESKVYWFHCVRLFSWLTSIYEISFSFDLLRLMS